VRRALISAFLAVAAACAGHAQDRARTDAFFERAKGLKQAGQMSLADLVPGNWDKVCFYGGYTDNPALKIANAETDWTLIFYRGEAEVGRIQGSYRRLVLNSPETTAPHDCRGRQAIIAWLGERALFRAPR